MALGRRLLLSAGLALLAGPLVSQGAAAETRGFVVTWFSPAHYEDGRECPQGMTTGPDIPAFLARFDAAERARLLKGENRNELQRRIMDRGPNGENVCENPTSVPDPGMRTVEGKTGFGLNLDGTEDGSGGASGCAHEKFTSPSGERVDNQWYRLRGCIPVRRNDGFLPKYHNGMMRDGNNTILIELRGVDDPRNDGEVEVGIYAGKDPVVTGPAGQILADSSLTVTDEAAWRAETKGRIVDGVLSTDPVDINFQSDNATPPGDYLLKAGRLRLTLLPDGKAKGLMAGYQPLDHLWGVQAPVNRNRNEGAGVGRTFHSALETTLGGPTTCPGYYYALHRLADGFKDPKTGQCTAISAAFDVEAVPAFIIHPPSAANQKPVQAAEARK